MSPAQSAVLVAGSFAAGVINSFAGGGGFITLPLLIVLGVSPTHANMTSTVATLPGLLTAAWAYRSRLGKNQGHLRLLGAFGLVGGTLGAWFLLASPAAWFALVVPHLMLFSTIFFIYGSWFLKRREPRGGSRDPLGWPLGIALFAISLYGGYWGGGMGIITLSALTLGGWSDINEMNAVKTLYMALINVTGALLFAWSGQVAWVHALLVFLGSSVGGYAGARWIQMVDQRLVRVLIAAYAAGITVYFFFRFY